MMTLTRWKINDCVDTSTADDDKNPNTLLFHQNLCKNLTKFDIVKYDMSTIRKPIGRDKTFILYAWHLLGAICLDRWISDPLIQVILETDTQINESWWSN